MDQITVILMSLIKPSTTEIKPTEQTLGRTWDDREYKEYWGLE